MNIQTALEKLRQGKKRKFAQTLDLSISLQYFDVRKEALNTFVTLPHTRPKRVAGFFTKRFKGVDVITEEDFSRYKDVKDMKKLAKKYDFFMASAPMMGKIATKFGRVFGPLGKMPSPQAGIIPKEEEAAVTAMRKKMDSVVRVKHKEAVIKLPVGKEDMPDADLIQNIETAIAAIKEKLPRKNENIKRITIKFTMSAPEVIYQSIQKKESEE